MSHPPFAAEVAACRAAQSAWAARPVRDRLRHVRTLRRLLVARTDELVAAAGADVGRTRVDVVGTELLPAAAALKYLETDAARVLALRRIGRTPTWLFGCRDAVHRRPWGVVGVIGTWNYPIFLNVGQVAQALAAGNGVLWKPSELAPRTAEVTTRLFADAGFPPDLLATLPATRDGGPQLAEAEIDHVVFTGSDVVGRKLAARLGERLVPSTLELSGCDAMFVLADADVPLAARAAWFGLTLNRGQTCIATRRLFVHRSRLAEFLAVLEPLVKAAGPVALATPGQAKQHERLVNDATGRGATVVPGAADGLTGGASPLVPPAAEPAPPLGGEGPRAPTPPGAVSASMGAGQSGGVSPPFPPREGGPGGLGGSGLRSTSPLVPPPAEPAPPLGGEGPRARSLPGAGSGDTAPGKSVGASPPFPLREGGPGGLGGSELPTLLLNAPPDAAVCREAAFSPVCAVLPFDTIDDALAQAALSPFGLAASVFTADTRAAEALAARIPAGTVTVNDAIAPTAHPATPFGGRGASGWGVTQGAEGLLAMTVPQAVSVRRFRFRPHVDEAVNPDPAATADILTGLLRATHAGGVREWFGGVRQLVRGVWRRKKG